MHSVSPFGECFDMRSALAALACAAAALTGCGQGAPTAETEQAGVDKGREQAPPAPLRERDPEAYKGNAGSVMSQIPAEKRERFRRLLECRVKRDSEAGRTVVVDATLLRGVLLQLERNPKAMLGCE